MIYLNSHMKNLQSSSTTFFTLIITIVLCVFVGICIYFMNLKQITIKTETSIIEPQENNEPVSLVKLAQLESEKVSIQTVQDKTSRSFIMKVNNIDRPFTASKTESSRVEIVNGKLNIATARQEGGLFQLVGLDATKSLVGTFSGTQFRLLLVSGSYTEEACTDDRFKENSKLVIEENKPNITGYYTGKVDCSGTIIEFQIPFDVKSPSPSFTTTN